MGGTRTATKRDIRIGMAVSGTFLFLIVIFVTVHGLERKADFGAFYASGLSVRRGDGAKLYDLREQVRRQEEALGRKGLMSNPYPPFVAIVFAPLTLLRLRNAYIAFGAINVVLLLLSWHILRNQSSAGAQPFRQLILWSLFLPVWIALIQGQFSILLLFSFAVAFWCLKRGRDYLGGLALGLGLFKFPVVLPFALIFLLRRKWRFIGGLTTAAGTLSLVSVMAIGRPGVLSYINLLADIMRHPANPAYATIEPWNMPTVRGFVMGILGSHIAEGWITPVAGVLSVCMILITVWRWKSNESGDNGQNFELMFGAALAVSLVTAPHLYVHDLTPLLLVIGLVVSSARWAAKSTADIIFIAGISILYALPFYYLKLLASNEVYVLAPFIVAIALAVMNMACRPALSDRAVGGMHPPSHVGVTS